MSRLDFNDALPTEILAHWKVTRESVSLESVPSGLSGARVYRCRKSKDQSFALKRWPIATSSERVHFVHRVVSLARLRGCQLIPQLHITDRGSTVFTCQRECWELSDWVSGMPLQRTASDDHISAGVAAIASFHQATFALRADSAPTVSAAIIARMKRLVELDHELPQAFVQPLPPELAPRLAEVVQLAREILRQHWTTRRLRIQRDLNRWADQTVANQDVLRDVHREHILFVPSELGSQIPSAIIDFDAVRADSPAVDLARWVGSFSSIPARSDDLLTAAAAEYRRHWRLNDMQCDLARTLIDTSCWINLANWVTWTVLRTRTFDDAELAAGNRMSELVDQVTESLTR